MDSCNHFDDPVVVTARSVGCEDCEKIGGQWVHLRLCLSCGHVGCCDSSPNRHATAHAHETEHKTIVSYEPGERWGWCYEHEAFIEELPPKFAFHRAR